MSDALLLFGRALLAQAFIAGAAYAAYALCAATLRDAPRSVRLAATPVAGMWLATLGYHALTALHAFHVPGACVALGVLVAAACAVDRRSGTALRCLRSDLRWLRRVRARLVRSRLRWVAAAIALGFGLVALRALASPIASWDGLTYHGIKAVLAVQTGRAPLLWAPGIWSYAGPTWGGHEALGAWVLLPLHCDLLGGLAELLQYAALGLALFALAREGRVREPFGSLGVAAVLAVPTLRLLVGSAYVEPAAMVGIAAGLLLVAHALRTRHVRAAVHACMALGLAAGMKLTLLPPVAALAGLAVVAALRSDAALPRRGLAVLAGAVAILVCTAPFALQSVTLTGAPLTPLPLRLGPLVLGTELPELQGYMVRASEVAAGQLAAELAALRRVFYLFPGRRVTADAFGFTTAFLLALGAYGALRSARRRPWLALAVLLAAVSTCAVYFAPGFAVVRQAWSGSSSRFLLPVVVALGPFAGAALARPGLGLTVGLVALALPQLLLRSLVGIKLATAAGWLTLGVMAAVALGAVALAYALRRTSRLELRRTSRALLGAGLVALALLGLAPLRDRVREVVWASGFQIHYVEKYWADAVQWVDEPGRARTIAVTSGPEQDLDNWFVLPFAGRRLQNRVVYVTPTRDGSIAHFGQPDVERAFAEAFDGDAWLGRLRAQGVTEVMSFRPRSLEQVWMEERPALFRKLAGGPDFGLFELLPATARAPLSWRRPPRVP